MRMSVSLACRYVANVSALKYLSDERQTGNTVFAALGVSNLPVSSPAFSWTKSVCSVVSFLLGSALIASFHRNFGERRRWVLALSFILQAILILVSAYLVHIGRSSDSPPTERKPHFLRLPEDPGFPWFDLIPIGLLSFQAAGKVVASRALQYDDLPCVVLTTLYTDLISDPGLLSAGLFSNVQRNRKAGGVAFYFAGAVVGGIAARNSIRFSGALWIAAGIQLSMAALWMIWRAEGEDFDEERVD